MLVSIDVNDFENTVVQTAKCDAAGGAQGAELGPSPAPIEKLESMGKDVIEAVPAKLGRDFVEMASGIECQPARYRKLTSFPEGSLTFQACADDRFT